MKRGMEGQLKVIVEGIDVKKCDLKLEADMALKYLGDKLLRLLEEGEEYDA